MIHVYSIEPLQHDVDLAHSTVFSAVGVRGSDGSKLTLNVMLHSTSMAV